MPAKSPKKVTVVMTAQMYERLEELASKEHRSVSAQVVVALESFLTAKVVPVGGA